MLVKGVDSNMNSNIRVQIQPTWLSKKDDGEKYELPRGVTRALGVDNSYPGPEAPCERGREEEMMKMDIAIWLLTVEINPWQVF